MLPASRVQIPPWLDLQALPARPVRPVQSDQQDQPVRRGSREPPEQPAHKVSRVSLDQQERPAPLDHKASRVSPVRPALQVRPVQQGPRVPPVQPGLLVQSAPWEPLARPDPLDRRVQPVLLAPPDQNLFTLTTILRQPQICYGWIQMMRPTRLSDQLVQQESRGPQGPQDRPGAQGPPALLVRLGTQDLPDPQALQVQPA